MLKLSNAKAMQCNAKATYAMLRLSNAKAKQC